jgi:hypothetical protein
MSKDFRTRLYECVYWKNPRTQKIKWGRLLETASPDELRELAGFFSKKPNGVVGMTEHQLKKIADDLEELGLKSCADLEARQTFTIVPPPPPA